MSKTLLVITIIILLVVFCNGKRNIFNIAITKIFTLRSWFHFKHNTRSIIYIFKFLFDFMYIDTFMSDLVVSFRKQNETFRLELLILLFLLVTIQ